MIRAWYSVMVILVGALVLGVSNAAYTSYVQHQSEERFRRAVDISNQRWCDLLNSLDHPETPSTTPRGKQIQLQIHELRLGLGCGAGQS